MREDETVAVGEPDRLGVIEPEFVLVVVRVELIEWEEDPVEEPVRVRGAEREGETVVVGDRVDDMVRVDMVVREGEREGTPLTEELRVPVVVRLDVIVEEEERVLVIVRVMVDDRVLVREADMVVVAVRESKGVRVVVGVRVRTAVPEEVREAAAEGVDRRVGLGDLEGNPERVAVRVVVAVRVGIRFIAASCRSVLKSCTE